MAVEAARVKVEMHQFHRKVHPHRLKLLQIRQRPKRWRILPSNFLIRSRKKQRSRHIEMPRRNSIRNTPILQ